MSSLTLQPVGSQSASAVAPKDVQPFSAGMRYCRNAAVLDAKTAQLLATAFGNQSAVRSAMDHVERPEPPLGPQESASCSCSSSDRRRRLLPTGTTDSHNLQRACSDRCTYFKSGHVLDRLQVKGEAELQDITRAAPLAGSQPISQGTCQPDLGQRSLQTDTLPVRVHVQVEHSQCLCISVLQQIVRIFVLISVAPAATELVLSARMIQAVEVSNLDFRRTVHREEGSALKPGTQPGQRPPRPAALAHAPDRPLSSQSASEFRSSRAMSTPPAQQHSCAVMHLSAASAAHAACGTGAAALRQPASGSKVPCSRPTITVSSANMFAGTRCRVESRMRELTSAALLAGCVNLPRIELARSPR
jgi:hypothetical protein